MIKLKNIFKKYDSKLVLDNISLSFKENRINILTGPSGCGKTTVFNIISGLDKNFSGEVSGVPQNIAYLFQEDRLLPYYTALENISFTLPDTIDKFTKKDIAIHNLNLMELEKEENSYPHQLSGGMARRIAIARALAYPSDLLLLDEPFNGLNIELKHSVKDAIKTSMQNNNKTVIIITHDTSAFNEDDDINLIDIIKLVD